MRRRKLRKLRVFAQVGSQEIVGEQRYDTYREAEEALLRLTSAARQRPHLVKRGQSPWTYGPRAIWFRLGAVDAWWVA